MMNYRILYQNLKQQVVKYIWKIEHLLNMSKSSIEPAYFIYIVGLLLKHCICHYANRHLRGDANYRQC